MILLLLHLIRLLPFLFGGHRQLALENLALRHQIAVYKRTVTRPTVEANEVLAKDKLSSTPTPPAASRATACAPIRCPSRSLARAPSPS